MRLVIFILTTLIGLSACESNVPEVSRVDDSRGKQMFDIHGQPWRFADYKGKWVIVNYWASWCKPCLTEVPELEAFYKAHQGKDAMVMGVNYDFVPVAETADLAKKYGISYAVLASEHDPRAQLGVDPIMVLPTTFIINPEGEVVASLVGEQTKDSLEQVIQP